MNAKELGAQLVNPVIVPVPDGVDVRAGALTIRMEFAKAAMHGLLANPITINAFLENVQRLAGRTSMGEAVAEAAVGYADSMLAKLAEEQP